jgi:hypothetical protein
MQEAGKMLLPGGEGGGINVHFPCALFVAFTCGGIIATFSFGQFMKKKQFFMAAPVFLFDPFLFSSFMLLLCGNAIGFLPSSSIFSFFSPSCPKAS